MKLFLKIIVAILLIAGSVGFYLLQPSGDLKNYKSYFPFQERTREGNEISVTFFGNTTLLFDDGQTQVLIDPFLSRPSKWTALTGVIDTDTALVTPISEHYFDKLKAVFVSHSHVDHILDLPLIAQLTNCKIFGSLSTQNYAKVNAVNETQLVDYDLINGHKVGHFHILPIASIHSKPTPFNNDLNQVFTSNHALPYKLKEFKEGGSFDFLIKHGKKTFLIKASYNTLKDQYHNQKVDVAFLGITGLGKANAKESDLYFNEVVKQLNPSIIVPIHWDDFLTPLKYPLTPIFRGADNVPKAFDRLIDQQTNYNYQFMLIDAYQTRIF